MTKKTNTAFTRRGALASMSAAAAAVASSATLAAASSKSAAMVSAEDRIALAWPTYHHLSPSDAAPAIGEDVVLTREAISPELDRAISVRTAQGRRLGYVPRDKAQHLVSIIDQGGKIPARVASRADEPVPGMVGWSVLSIEISGASAFV